MWQRTAMVVAVAATCAGCMTAEDRRAADEAKCRSYGFVRKNDAFAECLQRIDLARRADLRSASAFDPWDRPVIYRPSLFGHGQSRPLKRRSRASDPKVDNGLGKPDTKKIVRRYDSI